MKKIFTTILLSLLTISIAKSQVSFGGTPYSFSSNPSLFKGEVPIQKLSPINEATLLEEDEINTKKGKPMRIGISVKTQCDIETDGIWQMLPQGGKLWRMGFYSENAKALSVHFSKFDIPEGAELFIYNAQHDFVIGKFTSRNMSSDSIFYTQQVAGDTIFIEYYEPKTVSKPANIIISEIVHYYKSFFSKKTPNPGGSGSCEINVACTEGDNWRNQIRSVGYYELQNNLGHTYLCSGALINNVRGDKKQYFLSAYHCQEGKTIVKWVFYFNYQTTTCGSAYGIKNQSVTGANILAKDDYNTSSDFLLLEITQQIPDEYKVYFSGWDRRASTPTTGVCIHHPQGDWKKISLASSVVPGIVEPDDDWRKFWKVNWIAGANNKGVTEIGSSGSPYFDASKRIVGQLQGGVSSCSGVWNTGFNYDYYGKFSNSWNASSDYAKSLYHWLDPDNTNTSYIDGISYDEISIKPVSTSDYNLNIYPNPTIGNITISTSFLTSEAICRVFSLQGEQVHIQKLQVLPENTIDLHRFDSGSYLIEIESKGVKYFGKVILSK